MNVEHICGTGEPFTVNLYNYYRTDYHTLSYSNPELDYKISYQIGTSVNNELTPEEYFFDEIRMYVNFGALSGDFNLTTALHGNETAIKQHEYEAVYNDQFKFNNSIELGVNTIYFQKQEDLCLSTI